MKYEVTLPPGPPWEVEASSEEAAVEEYKRIAGVLGTSNKITVVCLDAPVEEKKKKKGE